MSRTREGIGSAQTLAEQVRDGALSTVEDVRAAIAEVARSTGASPWLVNGLAKDYLNGLAGTEEQRELFNDAIKLFPIKVEPGEKAGNTK